MAVAEQNIFMNEIDYNSVSADYDSDPQDETFAEHLGFLLTLYYTPLLICVGIMGNILSVLVFFKTKLRKLSSSYYLAALGISDTFFLLSIFTSWLSYMEIDVYSTNVYCQFFTYFAGLCSFLSVWFVVAFTVERFIAVVYPLKRQTMCTVRRAKIVLVCLIAMGSFINMPYLLCSGPVPAPDAVNITICDIREEYRVISKFIFLNYPFLSVALIKVCKFLVGFENIEIREFKI